MKETLFLGTYTKRDSKGVYQITLDTDKPELIELNHLVEEDNPTYLALSADKRLYCVTKAADKGGVAAYQLNEDGTFSFINREVTDGAPPCYVAVDEERQLVYSAFYHQGSVASYTIREDGGLELADLIQHDGNGPHANQQGPHVHYADLTPDNRLVVCDLGNDSVYTYHVAPDGKLTETARFAAEPGTGPRHLVFHPNKQTAYLFGELANTVTVLAYDAAAGSFEALQTVSTLPEDFHDFNGGAAIRISSDGKFLYASNRGHNSLAVFSVADNSESIKLIQLISVEGDFPRDFALDNSERFIVVANQNTDNLTLFQRDQTSGKLTLLAKDIYAPETVCTFFVPAND